MVKLSATKRNEAGKGASRRARREGKIPAVVYGQGMETQSVLLPGHETFLIVKNNLNAVINLDIEGTKQIVLLKEVQRHPVRRNILHVDLLAVSRDEKVGVDVPLSIVGEPVSGTAVGQEVFDLAVEVSPLAIPEVIEVNVDGLEEGTVLRVADLVLPEGVSCTLEDDAEILSVSAITATEEEEPVAEATEEAETAE